MKVIAEQPPNVTVMVLEPDAVVPDDGEGENVHRELITTTGMDQLVPVETVVKVMLLVVDD